MHGNITTRLDDAAIDSSRVDWDITVVGDPEPGRIAHYRVTIFDRETGVFIGSAFVPAGPGGGPPVVTVADVIELIGGFRVTSVIVQIDGQRLARQTRQVSDAVRRWHRAQRRRALRRAVTTIGDDRAGGRS
jgi:hypothetical protein